MKLNTFILALITTLVLPLTAKGGSGSGGGGLGMTRLLLKSMVQSQAVMTMDGLTSLPESETTAVLVVPAEEYQELVDEVKKVAAGGKPLVLTIELEDKSVRTFTLKVTDGADKEPIFPVFVEEKPDVSVDAQ